MLKDSKMLKGFKVTNTDRSRTIGLACRSFDELLKKASTKFNIKEKECCIYLQDGTLVNEEDFFSTLPPQTCLVLAKKGQRVLTGADIIYNALLSVNIDTLKSGLAVRQFIDDSIQKKIFLLSSLIDSSRAPIGDDLSHLSSRSDDPDWFKGLDTGSKTKEAFMRRRCGERMRGYLYKAEKDVKSNEEYCKMQVSADQALSELKRRLSENSYMGHYFDRSDDRSLCNRNGCFKCDGLWNTQGCESKLNHSINPYSNREQRIIFSTWNLDHRIEKSREVVPCLIRACLAHAEDPENSDVNTAYFYNLLFTTSNLRLVHIACHDKAAHLTAKCNQSLLLVKKSTDEKKGTKRKLTAVDESNQKSACIEV